jgi:hypothetical protein
MPTRHRRSSMPLRSGGARRKLVWATTSTSVTPAANTVTNVDLLSNLKAAGSSVLGVTIMRTHIACHGAATALVDTWTYGLIVGRQTDVGVALPLGTSMDPLGDNELDWMLNTRHYNDSNGAAVNATQNWLVDNRSKRKMEEMGMAYIFSVTNDSAAAQNFQLYARTLVALP